MNTQATPAALPAGAGARPLCVDLDGTLIRSDTLVESALVLLKRAPWLIVVMLLWLLRGKVALKTEIARRVTLDAATLPYRDELVAWLREQAAQRPLYLATAAHRSIGEAVARHLGLFAGVYATDTVNLSSRRKAEALTTAFGERGFDYAGNSRDDFAVWRAAGGIVVVGASAGVAAGAAAIGPVQASFEPQLGLGATLRLWIKALRIYQWVKNLLVFLAPLAAHEILRGDTFARALLAFAAFGLAASAIYLINDLLDLPSDRVHPRKRQRPFASGRLPLVHGLLLAPVLLAASLALAVGLGWRFGVVLASYVGVTTLYSIWLKRELFVDVLALAWLYTVRMIAGAVACGLSLSFWLLTVCAYGFLCLALVKRYAELASLQREQRADASGRAWRVQDMPVVLALGAAAGMVASLVMALYVDSEASHARYAHPEWLWSLFALMIAGVGRLWLVAGRGEMHDDPIVFVARDPACLMLLALGAGVLWMAI